MIKIESKKGVKNVVGLNKPLRHNATRIPHPELSYEV